MDDQSVEETVVNEEIDAGPPNLPFDIDEGELDQLRRWKEEAMLVLAEWERVWEAAGRAGPLGGSKAENVRRKIELDRAVLDAVYEWKYGDLPNGDPRESLHTQLARVQAIDRAMEAHPAVRARREAQP